ncbi:MAG: KEOPS complex subunit Pcc1 [Promethearchaeota archaeon]
MQNSSTFFIQGKINFIFNNSRYRDIAYNSYLLEFKRLQTKRSQISMKKKRKNLLSFEIKSKDITAFRASINDIIALGKIVENSIQIIN